MRTIWTGRVSEMKRGVQKKASALRQKPDGGWMRGLCVPFNLFRRRASGKSLRHSHPSRRFTSSVTTLPSTACPASLGMTRLHHLAEILRAARAELGDDLIDDPLEPGGIDRRRQVGLERRDLGRFLVRQIVAPALAELLDRIAPLLDERRHHLLRLRLVERPALLHFLVHQSGLGHPQRAEAQRRPWRAWRWRCPG